MSDIFEAWKEKSIHKSQLFITDGVIDKGLWESSNHKVMFLLKEAYDSKRVEGSWDLPSLIKRRGVSGRTFKPMAQWAYGIHQVLKDGEIAPYIQSNSEVRNSLFSSAIVNLKKSSGKKRSGAKDLVKYVDEDWNLLVSQIQEIAPEIIVCGNTWSLIKEKMPHKEKISDRVYKSGGIIYIDFWHPSNRASNLMNYYAICAIIQVAMKGAKSSIEL